MDLIDQLRKEAQGLNGREAPTAVHKLLMMTAASELELAKTTLSEKKDEAEDWRDLALMFAARDIVSTTGSDECSCPCCEAVGVLNERWGHQ